MSNDKLDATFHGPTCPECVAGKHGNCDGTALDPTTDDVVNCRCQSLRHIEVRPRPDPTDGRGIVPPYLDPRGNGNEW